jgi:peptidoglycan/xylan/chitin deacetylase (PgdA/CDA1 family)
VRDDTLILCYHAVSESWPSELAVEPEALRRQLRSLLDDGYQPLTFTDAVLANPGGRVFAATFDDAYKSVFDLARPILAELGVPGTLYVPTDFPESGIPFPLPGGAWIGTEHESELFCMDWDEVRRLRDEGWEIGAHTCSHPWLTQTAAEQLERELVRSRAICSEQLREPCRSIAYPYGDHDDRVVAAAGAAGYDAACTVPHRFEEFDDAPLRYARIDVTRTESPAAFRLRTASWSRRARATAAARVPRWLDANRPRRSTVLAAIGRRRRRRAVAAALEAACLDASAALAEQRGAGIAQLQFRSGTVLRFARPSQANLERFGEIFVTRPYTRHFEIGPGDVVLDVGAGEGLFAIFALEQGCDRVVCVEPDPELAPVLDDNIERNRLERFAVAAGAATAGALDLDALTPLAGTAPIGLLKLEGEGAAAAVLAASEQALARVDRLVLGYDPETSPRVDEVVGRLQQAGFETWLDLDEASGAGYVSCRRVSGAGPAPAV